MTICEATLTKEAAFFDLPESGLNSQAGTLIHELSHFVLVGETNKDTSEIYGIEEAEQLALDDPEAAQKNAENYQFFAESMFWPSLAD